MFSFVRTTIPWSWLSHRPKDGRTFNDGKPKLARCGKTYAVAKPYKTSTELWINWFYISIFKWRLSWVYYIYRVSTITGALIRRLVSIWNTENETWRSRRPTMNTLEEKCNPDIHRPNDPLVDWYCKCKAYLKARTAWIPKTEFDT